MKAAILNLNRPVDWDTCVYGCGRPFPDDSADCRVYGFKDGRVGAAHGVCAAKEALKR